MLQVEPDCSVQGRWNSPQRLYGSKTKREVTKDFLQKCVSIIGEVVNIIIPLVQFEVVFPLN